MSESAPAARTFQPSADSVRAARRFVAATLESSGADTATEQCVLLASELVTNAVLHARTAYVVEVLVAGDVVRIAVSDGSGVVPSRRGFNELAGSGRGLHLVEALASRWGVEAGLDGGKKVWFEVHASAARSATFDLDSVEQI